MPSILDPTLGETRFYNRGALAILAIIVYPVLRAHNI